MLSPALVTLYTDCTDPQVLSARLPSALETLTITLRLLFSTRGRYTCDISAGAAILTCSVSSKAEYSKSKAASGPGVYKFSQSLQCLKIHLVDITYDPSVVVEIVEPLIAKDILDRLDRAPDGDGVADVQRNDVKRPFRIALKRLQRSGIGRIATRRNDEGGRRPDQLLYKLEAESA